MTYEYRCNDCEAAFAIKASVAEKTAGLSPVCPGCGSKKITQVFSVFGIIPGTIGGPGGTPPGCQPGGGCCG
jgi:putative FmdB family regulatory protein